MRIILAWLFAVVALAFAEALPLNGFRGIGGASCQLEGGVLKGRAASRNAGVAAAFAVAPGRRTTFCVEVRGSGKVRASVNGRQGRVFSRVPVELSAEWQTIAISYAETTAHVSFGLYLAPGCAEASFELRNLTAELEAMPELADLAVAPVCIRAAERPARHARLRKDTGEMGLANKELLATPPRRDGLTVVWGRCYSVVACLPVPLTSRPVYYYVRMRHGGKMPGGAALIHHESQQNLAPEARCTGPSRWEWLRLGPVAANLAFPEVAVKFIGGEGKYTEFQLDRTVVTTDGSLKPADLDAVPCQEDGDGGAVAVGRGTPKVDGELDAVWRDSLPLGPFLLQGRMSFASEQTTARLLWDDENLYVFFHCLESALTPAANRLQEFRRNITAHDELKQTYQDDCVSVLLVNPNSDRRVHDILVSASGAVLDCASPREDMWLKRDTAWESGVRAAIAVRTESTGGFWDAELAIPWAALGGKPGVAPWHAKLSRIEKPSKETSGYQPIRHDGLHQDGDFIELRFAERLPGASITAWPEFTPGPNRLALQSVSPLLLTAESTFAKQRPVAVHGAGDLAINLEGKDAFQFRWRVADASLREVLRSPRYRLALSAETLEVALPAGARLLCNGRPADRGAILATGLNELELAADEKAAVRLAVDGVPIPFPDGWTRTAPNRWRLILADGATELWPNWKSDGLHLIRGGVQQLFFCPRGFPGKTVRDYAIVLDLPEGVRVQGASGYIRYYETAVQEAPFSPLGKGWRRWRVAVAGQRPWSENYPSEKYIVVQIEASERDALKTGAFYFHAESLADGITEAPQKVPLVFLPPIQGVQPKELAVRISCSRLGALTDQTLLPPMLSFLRSMGFTGFTSATQRHYDELPNAIYFNFKGWNFHFKPFLARHPEAALVYRNGTRSNHEVCPRILTTPECRRYILEFFPKWHAAWGKLAIICWDYELGGPFDSEIACYCDQCRADFAKTARLPTVPVRAEIIVKHRDAWVEFMTTRFADLAEYFCKAAHEAIPGIVFSVYSAYQSPANKLEYGVDWAKLDGRIDLASAGYGRVRSVLDATRAALPSTPLMLGAIVTPYDFGDKRPVPPFTLAQLLRRAADANAGFFVYYLPSMDGRSFTAVARASRIIAQYEAFFKRRENHLERLAAAGLPEENAALLADGKGNGLLILMNHAVQPRTFRLDAAKLGLPDLPSQITIPPGDAAVFHREMK